MAIAKRTTDIWRGNYAFICVNKVCTCTTLSTCNERRYIYLSVRKLSCVWEIWSNLFCFILVFFSFFLFTQSLPICGVECGCYVLHTWHRAPFEHSDMLAWCSVLSVRWSDFSSPCSRCLGAREWWSAFAALHCHCFQLTSIMAAIRQFIRIDSYSHYEAE